MRALWRDAWLDVPCYSIPRHGVLVGAEVTRPLATLQHASGRVMRRPGRKVLRFLATDGPRATYRKARTKIGERRFSGDYRVAAVLGARDEHEGRVVALACRVPPAAEYVLVHERLVRDVPAEFSLDDFARVADRLAEMEGMLEQLGAQAYLYSGEEPPAELVEALARALEAPTAPRRRTESSGGTLIHLPGRGNGRNRSTVLELTGPQPHGGRVPVALLGAGDYARTEILPALEPSRVERVALADREPQIAALVGREGGFRLATTGAERAIEALPEPGIVFVATYHDSHAELAGRALEAGHRVFLEKPAAVTDADLALLLDRLDATGGVLEIGFNRRYNPLVRRARGLLRREEGPATVTCVVKEVPLEPNHWYLWPNQGTRITGNVCHWIDLGVYLIGGTASPVTVTVSPSVSVRREEADEERTLAVTFDDGSVLTVVATGRGDDVRGVQEFVEARRGGTTVVLDDLWRLRALRGGRTRTVRTTWRDKGHRRMFSEATERLLRGAPSSYSRRDLALVSLVHITASRLVREGRIHERLDPRAVAALEPSAPPPRAAVSGKVGVASS